jgi:glycosyltransferase involved in cell wall biosynthesis
VAFQVGGVPELVVDGLTGLLAPAFDVDRFCREVLCLLTDPARREALGAGARALALQRYRIEQTADRYQALYAEAFAAAT